MYDIFKSHNFPFCNSGDIPATFLKEWANEIEDWEEKCDLGYDARRFIGSYGCDLYDRAIVYRVVHTKHEHVVWSYRCDPSCLEPEEVKTFAMAKHTDTTWELERKWRDVWNNVSIKKFDKLKEEFTRVCEVKKVPRGVLRLLQPTIKLTNGAELTVIHIVHD